jgi:hypothetical protein
MKAKVRTFNHLPINFGVDQGGPHCHRQGRCRAQAHQTAGEFLSNVYEWPFKDTGKWCKDFERFAKKKAFVINTWYMWYTTCPKCAKKYGTNYVVVLAR